MGVLLTMDKKISDFATEKSLTGFEFLSCIPGSIGGSITMNSGCYGEDISKIFYLTAINLDGQIETFLKSINFLENNKRRYHNFKLQFLKVMY